MRANLEPMSRACPSGAIPALLRVVIAAAAFVGFAAGVLHAAPEVLVTEVGPERRGHGRINGIDGHTLLIAPNPLVLGRDEGGDAVFRLAPEVAPETFQWAVEFVPRSPFALASAQAAAGRPITLGLLAAPIEPGRFPYVVRIQDETGAARGEARGTVEICETRAVPRSALFLAGCVGLLFLIANYAERGPLTRTYEDEH